MKYGTLNLGQIEALGNILGGEEKILNILRGSIRVNLEPAFPVWKKVKIGGFSVEQLISLLESEPDGLRDYERDTMRMPTFTTVAEKHVLNLALCRVRDLGLSESRFHQGPTTATIQEQVRQRGGTLCPAEVGPHLRLQFRDQEAKDSLWVMMDQILDPKGYPIVWRLNGEKGYRFTNRAAAPDRKWSLDDKIVFVAPPT